METSILLKTLYITEKKMKRRWKDIFKAEKAGWSRAPLHSNTQVITPLHSNTQVITQVTPLHSNTQVTPLHSNTETNSSSNLICPTKIKRQRSSYFHLLPEELWLEILKFLTPSELCKMSMVSSCMRRISSDSWIWALVVGASNSKLLTLDPSPKHSYLMCCRLREQFLNFFRVSAPSVEELRSCSVEDLAVLYPEFFKGIVFISPRSKLKVWIGRNTRNLRDPDYVFRGTYLGSSSNMFICLNTREDGVFNLYKNTYYMLCCRGQIISESEFLSKAISCLRGGLVPMKSAGVVVKGIWGQVFYAPQHHKVLPPIEGIIKQLADIDLLEISSLI
jgi:hypothetical protein